MTLGPGQRVHARTDGPCRWGIIRLPSEHLTQYGRALRGAGFVVLSARSGDPRARVWGNTSFKRQSAQSKLGRQWTPRPESRRGDHEGQASLMADSSPRRWA